VRDPRIIYRRRRAAAAGICALVALLATVLVVRACGGTSGRTESASGHTATIARTTAPQHPQLPGGGRQIFPEHRVVAFYGAPQAESLGVLGIGTPAHAAARLKRVAARYERGSRPVLPAFELLATIADAGPGEDGLHRTHQPAATIDRYLAAARRVHALLVLDIQPGWGDFLGEAERLQRWLLAPDVGIALDPEWHLPRGEIPGTRIGSVTAKQINAVSTYVSDLVVKHDLPQKLFVIHQFTHAMIAGRQQIAARPGLAITMNIDGFGTPGAKISKYHDFTADHPRFYDGFKLFYVEDTNIMSPGAVLGLRPPPDLVVYE
jgi:hypothetical protein